MSFPANFNLSKLNGANGFKLSGVAAKDLSGSSVASAGDVNGDGFADLIVGARDADPHGDRSGASYVVFGEAGGFGANLNLAKLNGANGFKLSGVGSYDYSSGSVASAGDVNGDGFADLIVGAYGADPHGSGSGASYVVFGKAASFGANLNLAKLNGANGFKLSGVGSYDYSSGSVASAGDVNGDGFADLIVGADGADPHGGGSGASYVVFGKAASFGANLNLAKLNGTNGFKLSGVAAGDGSGEVASAGDVNGDGFADLIIGAGGADPHGNFSGASYVVFGKAGGFGANLNLSKLNGANGFKLSGVAKFDHSGYSVASAGDVNGDGFADVIVGTQGAGAYVVFGKAASFGANLDLSSLNGANGFKLSGVSDTDFSGGSVASAGDVNGDGFADLVVGAWQADPHGDRSGASYVVFGKAAGFSANLDLSTLDGANGFKLSGVAAYDYSGQSVASAGDVNGDGFADLIVGAPGADPHGRYSGASYVVFGKAAGFDANLDLSSLNGAKGFRLSGVAAVDYSGFSVASAGDVNGDGFADLIVGACRADPHGGKSGASYVVFGIKPDTAVTRTGTNASQNLAGGDLKDVLSGLGGDDALWGHGGKDKLKGGDGDDTLRGGLGNDWLEGGADSDSFVFSTKLDKQKNVDKIADFSHGDDTILLDNAIFKKLKDAGELKGKFFEIGKADDKNDYVLYDKQTGTLSYDADGSKHQIKPIEFAHLDDHLKLKADDFLIV